jgi:hypothetical protein
MVYPQFGKPNLSRVLEPARVGGGGDAPFIIAVDGLRHAAPIGDRNHAALMVGAQAAGREKRDEGDDDDSEAMAERKRKPKPGTRRFTGSFECPAGYLTDPNVKTNIASMLNSAHNGVGGTWDREYGFWGTIYGDARKPDTYGVGTSRDSSSIVPYEMAVYPWFSSNFHSASPNVFIHSHNGEGLSGPDKAFAEDEGLTVIAISRNGRVECYTGSKK